MMNASYDQRHNITFDMTTNMKKIFILKKFISWQNLIQETVIRRELFWPLNWLFSFAILSYWYDISYQRWAH